MCDQPEPTLKSLIEDRFGSDIVVDLEGGESEILRTMLTRGSCRAFEKKTVPDSLVQLLVAAALASPTKSDLQQRDIILLKSPDKRRQLSDLVSGQAWVRNAPMIAVFCGNNRRQRLMHEWLDVPFANDHIDAFFNAAGDAAIALGAFVTAAEALGIGTCPISAVRNKAEEVSRLLDLPDHVFPFAGLAFGYPTQSPVIAKRLPLNVTCHIDTFTEEDLRGRVESYSETRRAAQPYNSQRFAEDYGTSDTYGWVEDKVRQYAKPERDGFGRFIQMKGFLLT